MPDESTPWVVKGVSAETRRKIKVYAAQHDLTMGQAITELVDLGLYADMAAAQEGTELAQGYRPGLGQDVHVILKARPPVESYEELEQSPETGTRLRHSSPRDDNSGVQESRPTTERGENRAQK